MGDQMALRPRTKWYLDTEFHEHAGGIDLISIGLVCEDGSEYYSEVDGAEHTANGSDWLKQNVLPHLTGDERSRDLIANEIREVVCEGGSRPEFWAYFADYDWVVFCRLYGRMIDLPDGYPMFCRDLKQLMDDRGVGKVDLPPQDGVAHNALADARWVRAAHQKIVYDEGICLQQMLRRELRMSGGASTSQHVALVHDGVYLPIGKFEEGIIR